MKTALHPKPRRLPIDWRALRPRVTEALLVDITRRIVEAFHPKKILLFGSYARGTPREDSDLDILVIMDSTEPMAMRMTRVAQVAEVPFLSMDVLVYTPGEIRARRSVADPFLTEVLAQGRVLYPRGRGR